MRIFGLLCSLILGSVALSPWLGSCESANFCLNTFKIPCLRRICTTRNGVPAGMGSAAWLEVFLTCDSCVGDRLVAESMKTRSFMRGPRGDFAHLLVLLAPWLTFYGDASGSLPAMTSTTAVILFLV